MNHKLTGIILLFHFCFTIFINVQCIRVNYTEAVRLCRDKGGPAASSYFPRAEVALSNNEQPRGFVLYSQLKNIDLENGESAWVAGYAKYGELWNHLGCYTYFKVYTHHGRKSFSENKEHSGFYQCSTYCEKKTMRFFCNKHNQLFLL